VKQDRDPKPERGIRCPQCGCRHFYTTNTEPLRDGRIRRRKICRNCGRRLITFEGTSSSLKTERC
jgi:transcriptional regulator NrdR family protein